MTTNKHIKPIDYKKKYQQAIAAMWIMLLITSLFYWHINIELNQLNKDIIALDKEQQAEIYIKAGWMPPYELLKGEDLDD